MRDKAGRRSPSAVEPLQSSWRLIGRYLLWLAALNLAWEIAQLPLYTLWRDSTPGYIAFAVAHCTAGDIVIGAAALALALIATRQWLGVVVTATSIGVAYTFFSEWMNTAIRASWTYSELMPTVRMGTMVVGLAPLAQWLVLPPVSFYLARGRNSVRRT